MESHDPSRGVMGRLRSTALGFAVLCVLAAATTLSLQRAGAGELLERTAPAGRGAIEFAMSTQQLYQIGDQEYLSMSSGSVEDIADEVGKKLGKELIMLKKIEKAAAKGKRVFVKVEAGQIGTRGRSGPKGYLGPTGFQGARGPRGYRGSQGPRGDKGPTGIKGVKGDDGDDGPHGNKGDTGSRGPPGPKGRRGREGRRGPEGSVGSNGLPGPNGLQGEPGPRGPAAAAGLRGTKGVPGPAGSAGRAGDPGVGGDEGAPGAPGMNGANGVSGPPGIKGEAGKSMCGIGTQLGHKLCCGEVDPSDLQADSNYNHYATVNMRKCKFSGEPTVFTSIACSNNCGETTSLANIITENNVMNPEEFKVYARSVMSRTLAETRSDNWKIQWCAFGESAMTPENMQMCCGSSAATGWGRHNSDTVTTSVNTAGCEFKSTPYYFTSLSDKACGAELLGSARCGATAIGTQGIYSSSKSGFQVYLKSISGETALNAATSNSNGWQLNWCGVAKLPPSVDGAGGYPCTAPRVLNGNNVQIVFSNDGGICCDKTTSSGWKASGIKAISKEVDVSACGFKQISYTLLNVRGDNPLQMVSGTSAWAPTTTAGKITVYMETNGKYKFYNADQYHWKVQYCVIGR